MVVYLSCNHIISCSVSYHITISWVDLKTDTKQAPNKTMQINETKQHSDHDEATQKLATQPQDN